MWQCAAAIVTKGVVIVVRMMRRVVIVEVVMVARHLIWGMELGVGDWLLKGRGINGIKGVLNFIILMEIY